MNNSQKKRLCWNCEGSVSIAEETCPFCGVSVVPAFLEGTNNSYAPPYAIGSTHETAVPRSPYDPIPDDEDASADPVSLIKGKDAAEPAADEFKSTILAVTLLLTGSVFFMFGLVLALFSHDGVLTLRWDGAYWYIYTALAIPLFFFGWRSLSHLE